MKFIDKVTDLVGIFSAFVLAVLVLLVVYDATARYLFSTGSVALQELEWHLFDIVIMLGIAYALKEGAHVRVDIFYDRFSKRMQHIIDIITIVLFVLPVSFLIIYVSYDFVLMSFEQLERSSDAGGLPFRFLIKSLIPLAFAFVVLQALREVIGSYTKLKAQS